MEVEEVVFVQRWLCCATALISSLSKVFNDLRNMITAIVGLLVAAFEAKTKLSITCRLCMLECHLYMDNFFLFHKAPWSMSPALNPNHTCRTIQQLTSHDHQKYELDTYELLLCYNCQRCPVCQVFTQHLLQKIFSIRTMRPHVLCDSSQHTLD